MNLDIIEGLSQQQIVDLYNEVIDTNNNSEIIGSTYCVYCPDSGFYGCKYYPGAPMSTGYAGCWTDYGADNSYNCCAMTWACGAGRQGCSYVHQTIR